MIWDGSQSFSYDYTGRITYASGYSGATYLADGRLGYVWNGGGVSYFLVSRCPGLFERR